MVTNLASAKASGSLQGANQAGAMTEVKKETYRAFVMTDLIGSTALSQSAPQAFSIALREHNEIAATVFKQHGGRLLKSRTQGDSLLGEFRSAADAVRGAVSFRDAMKSAQGIHGKPLEIRTGVHYGVCYGIGADFQGHTLNLCARIRDAGHGSQILTTGIVAELAQQLQGEGLQFHDLGWHGLRDIVAATRIYQIERGDSKQQFPPIRSDARFKLPVFATQFLGRTREIDQVNQLFELNRCILIVGPGGMGKTRFAVAAAELIASKRGWPSGFASLIEAVDLPTVEQVLAGTLGEGDLSMVSKVLDSTFLLVIDNCEHVATEVKQVVERLLQNFPHLRLLLTSRSRLDIQGCSTVSLGGLDVSTAGAAEQLFLSRARANDVELAVTPSEREVIATICREADGVPLVIELAASRINTLTIDQIQHRVFELIRSLGSGVQERHRSIDSLIASSISLLSDRTRQVSATMSRFAGGFTLETAEYMCGSEVERDLAELFENSLLMFDRNARPEPRYRFLEVIRRHIVDHSDTAIGAPRFWEWGRERAEQISKAIPEETALAEASVEMPNLRVVLRDLELAGDKNRVGLSIANALARYWLMGSLSEGRTWLASLLSLNPTPLPEEQSHELYANALNRLGVLAYKQQQWATALASYHRAAEYAAAIGNETLTYSIRLNEGLVHGEQDAYELARPLLASAESYFRNTDLKNHWMRCLLNLGRVELRCSNLDEATDMLNKAASIAADSQDHHSYAICKLNLAESYLLQDRDSDAENELASVQELEPILDTQQKALYHLLHGVLYSRRGQDDAANASIAYSKQILLDAGEEMNAFDARMTCLAERLNPDSIQNHY